MAAKKRSGLGRGIGALIPQATEGEKRPVDVFFPANGEEAKPTGRATSKPKTTSAAAAAAAAAVAAGHEARSGTGSSERAADERAADANLREVPGATLTRLPVAEIAPNRLQPRQEFDEEALEELTHSVREFGVFQPIVVREVDPTPEAGEPRYELIMGERRLRASKRAGLDTIPAIIRSTADEHMLRDALLENLHRAQLNPLEEASAYQQLLSDFGITQEQLAERIGRSRPQISNTIRLLRLPEPVQARVAAGVLSAGHARAILSLDGDADAMQQLADKVVNEGLSVRAAEAVATAAPKRKPPKPRAGGVQAQLGEIAERLGDRFDTRVAVKLGAKKGQIVIDFATIGDLKRILSELGDEGFN
ncbi:ParB/RepB/Spo0J family partition protein [Leucobacter sp. GX24907]